VLLTIISVVVPLTFPFHEVAPAGQDNRHEQLILARAAAAIHNAEPEWQYITGVFDQEKARTMLESMSVREVARQLGV